MPVQPKTYKLVCSKCGFTKIVAPKSDCLNPKDLMAMSSICSKCGEQMERKDKNILDNVFSIFK